MTFEQFFHLNLSFTNGKLFSNLKIVWIVFSTKLIFFRQPAPSLSHLKHVKSFFFISLYKYALSQKKLKYGKNYIEIQAQIVDHFNDTTADERGICSRRNCYAS